MNKLLILGGGAVALALLSRGVSAGASARVVKDELAQLKGDVLPLRRAISLSDDVVKLALATADALDKLRGKLSSGVPFLGPVTGALDLNDQEQADRHIAALTRGARLIREAQAAWREPPVIDPIDGVTLSNTCAPALDACLAAEQFAGGAGGFASGVGGLADAGGAAVGALGAGAGAVIDHFELVVVALAVLFLWRSSR